MDHCHCMQLSTMVLIPTLDGPMTMQHAALQCAHPLHHLGHAHTASSPIHAHLLHPSPHSLLPLPHSPCTQPACKVMKRAPCVLFMAPHACTPFAHSLTHALSLVCVHALFAPWLLNSCSCPCPTLALVHPCHCHPPCAISHAHSHPHATSCVHGAIHIFILLRYKLYIGR